MSCKCRGIFVAMLLGRLDLVSGPERFSVLCVRCKRLSSFDSIISNLCSTENGQIEFGN